MVSWKLYGHWRLCLKVLGSVEKTLGELFEGGSTSVCVYFPALIHTDFVGGADIHLFNGTFKIAVLKVSGSSSSKALMDELVPSIKKPSEKYKFLDSSETLGTVFDAAKGMVNALTGVRDILLLDLYCLTRSSFQGAPRSHCRLGISVYWV